MGVRAHRRGHGEGQARACRRTRQGCCNPDAVGAGVGAPAAAQRAGSAAVERGRSGIAAPVAADLDVPRRGAAGSGTVAVTTARPDHSPRSRNQSRPARRPRSPSPRSPRRHRIGLLAAGVGEGGGRGRGLRWCRDQRRRAQPGGGQRQRHRQPEQQAAAPWPATAGQGTLDSPLRALGFCPLRRAGRSGASGSPVGAVAAGTECLGCAGLDFSGAVPLDRADAVVAADHQAVLEPFGRETALFLGGPFLQPAAA